MTESIWSDLDVARNLCLAKIATIQKHGRTVEEAGRLAYEIGEAEFEAIPGWVRRVIGVLWFSRWFTRRLQKRAASSQARKYSGGYVLAYVEGDGQDFDYGIDYIECASCKFLNDQGATELGPYVCAVDKVASEMLGWGLRRTMTLAEGGERCDFRFKKGRKTCVTIPQSLSQKENGLDGKE
ncbi:MAG: L-2-amino-thiazoline-4-carboxylic acid hydrolase [Anaerolineae bacterium]